MGRITALQNHIGQLQKKLHDYKQLINKQTQTIKERDEEIAKLKQAASDAPAAKEVKAA